MRVLVDSSCLVAAALPRHEHHAATLRDLSRRRALGQTFLVAAHSLVETYAVLTRLPSPFRLSGPDALAILDRNWRQSESVALTSEESWAVIADAAETGVTGGRVYDHLIAACARKAAAEALLTWNVRHFAAVPGTPAVTPGA